MFHYVILVFLIATMMNYFPNVIRFIASVVMCISFAIALMYLLTTIG